MSSINATIEEMTRKGTLSGVFGAYAYAALLVAGPWIFTVFGLLFLGATGSAGPGVELTTFRSIIIYNSMFSLIVSSPLAFLGGRYVSEQRQSGSGRSVFYVLFLSIAAFGTLTLCVAGPFYIIATTLDPVEKVLSIQSAVMIGLSWLLIPFLGAILAYNTVLVAFGSGAAVMLVAGMVLSDPRAAELLIVFNCSFAIANLIMLMRLVSHFGSKLVVDTELRAKLVRNWELPAAGGAYALGLWIDKIIMWHANSPDGLVVAGALQTMPNYDTAMFWSQLSSIPVIAVFFVHIETRFSTSIRRYHTRMQQRASLRELNEIAAHIKNYVLSSMFGLFLALAIVAGLMIMLSIVFMTQFGLRPAYMSTLRVSTCSMAFYTSAMFCFSFLLHLDLRRPALKIVSTFLILNFLLTLAFLPLGSSFYGYGNMIAASVSLLVGFSLVLNELSWLHYHAFVTNNPSI